jgi:hypothetical protein
MEFDGGLGPYPFDLLEKWKSLSNRITPQHLERIRSIGATVAPAAAPPSAATATADVLRGAVPAEVPFAHRTLSVSLTSGAPRLRSLATPIFPAGQCRRSRWRRTRRRCVGMRHS